jgi:predicted metal-dependent phosphoesterase TrpH
LKLDAHVHTYFSGNTTIYPVSRMLKESYNTPEKLYRLAKARGMDLVTITDHDAIGGVLTIADRKDVIIGEEVTAVFPADRSECHIGVLGINEEQHREIQRLRHNIYELLPYLRQQDIFCTFNHLASLSAGRLTAAQISSVIPWVSAIETRNGTRLPSQNRTAAALAQAHGKVTMAGSDSHTYRGIGYTYVVCEKARNREEFLRELRQGNVRVEGSQGWYFTLTGDIIRLTAALYKEKVMELIEKPWRWQRELMVVCLTLGLPVVSVAILISLIHYLQDERFNRGLLFDLVAQAPQHKQQPVLAQEQPVLAHAANEPLEPVLADALEAVV